MVKYFGALLIVMALAAPAFAQDVPQIELGFGYGNVDVKDVVSGRHSGFATHQTINLNSWIGVDNYLGYYGLGQELGTKTQLLTTIFGGKFTYRAEKVQPYLVAGIGGAWLMFPDSGQGTNSVMAFRYGGGIDIPFKDNFAWKVDVSRMSFHFAGWNAGTNLSTGIVIKITQ
jgi:hypothetical protein